MSTKSTNDAVLFKDPTAAVDTTPYILYYRQGSNPHPQFFIFFHKSPPGKIRDVVDRIKKHCELMNLRFVNVRPAIVDLDEAEAKAYGGSLAAQE